MYLLGPLLVCLSGLVGYLCSDQIKDGIAKCKKLIWASPEEKETAFLKNVDEAMHKSVDAVKGGMVSMKQGASAMARRGSEKFSSKPRKCAHSNSNAPL